MLAERVRLRFAVHVRRVPETVPHTRGSRNLGLAIISEQSGRRSAASTWSRLRIRAGQETAFSNQAVIPSAPGFRPVFGVDHGGDWNYKLGGQDRYLYLIWSFKQFVSGGIRKYPTSPAEACLSRR